MFDGILAMWVFGSNCGFFGGAFLKKVPLIRKVITATEGVFVPRMGTPEEKEKFV